MDQCRLKFERHIRKERRRWAYPYLDREGDGYEDEDTDRLWRLWKEAWDYTIEG